MKCTYVYKNRITFNSEELLDDFILNNGIELTSKYGDIALQVSYTLNILNQIKEETKDLLKKYKEEKIRYNEDGVELEFKPPYIGVSKFLKGLKNERDKLLTPEFRDLDYWLNRLDDWKKGKLKDTEIDILGLKIPPTEFVSKEELKKFLEKEDSFDSDNTTLACIGTIRKHWMNQGKTGTAIHDILKILFHSILKEGPNKGKLMLELPADSLLKMDSMSNELLTEENIIDIINYAKLLKLSLENKLGEGLLFFPEFQVSGQLIKEVEGKGDKILGIIDLLIIDLNGKAHILDYKASPSYVFDSAKERTFYYQLGLYHRMLSQNGVIFSEENTTMIAPILMEKFRNENNKYVMDSVKARNSEQLLEDITNQTTLHTIRENLDEFIPIQVLLNLPPEEISEKIKKFDDTLFPIVSSNVDDKYIQKYIERQGGIQYDKKTNKYFIKDKEYYTGNSEEEVIEKVTKFFKETLPKQQEDVIKHTRSAFKKALKEGTTDINLPEIRNINSSKGASENWLRDFIGKYANGNYIIHENEIFNAYGIIVLENIKTKQLDFVKITIEDVYDLSPLNGNKLLTGNIHSDRIQMRKLDDMTLQATIGNIHTMRVMALINCMPELTKGGRTIGNINVINPIELKGNPSPSAKELIYNFNELIKHVENFDNNINPKNFADSVLLMRNKLEHILSFTEQNRYSKFKQFTTTLTELDSAISENDELKKINLLQKLIKELEKKFKGQLELTLDSYDESTNPARALYESAMLALAQLKGISFRLQIKHNSRGVEFTNGGVQSLMMDNPGNLDNNTLNNLVTLVTQAYQNVREDVQRHMKTIRQLTDAIKNKKGFNKIKEMTIGNAASLYSNLIYEKNGDLLFKNPWENEVETEEETEFLKYALTVINENRYSGDVELMRLNNDIRYFRVPLVKGDIQSESAVLGGLSNVLKNKLKRIDPRNWIKLVEEKTKKLTELAPDKDNRNLFEMVNMFNESDTETRLSKIRTHGVEYFERNLETLLIKHIFAFSQQRHINGVMPMAKASMIHLIVQGNLSNQKFNSATKYIEEYVRNKIKNEDINDSYPELWKAVGKIRNAASFLILAFNPVLYPGLLIGGLLQDIRIILLNLGRDDTPFTPSNFKNAWRIVYSDILKIGNKSTVCSLLNEFYGFNDMDMNTYAEKIKSDKYGIFNFTNIAFHCASRPDFFNRMSLFVTQMFEDGTWEAHKMNSKGELVYNFKEDKRFDAYANNNKSDVVKYNKQKALYEIMAKQLIDEGALNKDGTIFKFGQDLPKAYTNKQIESIKNFGDTIFGYYTHEKKAMIHAYWYGALWMQMRTFWSGKKNQYLGTSGVKVQGRYVHLKDANGKEMYYKLENGVLVPQSDEITSQPVLKWEGLWQEGILCSLLYLMHDVKEKGWKVTLNELRKDPEYQLQYANLVQLAYDITMFMVLAPIIAAYMGDWADELEKDSKKSLDVNDGIMATAARIALKTVNYGFLDFNFFESIGGPIIGIQPVSFSYMTTRISDLIDCMTGDKTLTNALIRTSSVTNNMRPLINTIIN